MAIYAIRQKSTGYFLPQRKSNRGFTWDVPTKDCVPRLFSRKSSAQNALNWWLDGRAQWNMGEGNWQGPAEPFIETVKDPQRKRDDMEVVEMILVELV